MRDSFKEHHLQARKQFMVIWFCDKIKLEKQKWSCDENFIKDDFAGETGDVIIRSDMKMNGCYYLEFWDDKDWVFVQQI